ncbi:hypothetical protein [Actinoallomurus iriomotensis]|uniref:hypothetical protein n=1 Tax=Actinoallomurus iriomotensis TaxID=478107 RepID=UPI002556BC4F|nr:hypothetical protein [Actinoallomurus iriomotensis]
MSAADREEKWAGARPSGPATTATPALEGQRVASGRRRGDQRDAARAHSEDADGVRPATSREPDERTGDGNGHRDRQGVDVTGESGRRSR